MANRTARLRREEEAFIRNETFRKALQESKQHQRLQRSPARLCREMEEHFQGAADGQRQALRQLLRRKSVNRALGANNGFFLAVLHCLETGTHWRTLANWRAPRSRNAVRLFESLSGHVFVHYPLPATLKRAMVHAVAVDNDAQHPAIAWFFHVARGENLSQAKGLPFEFTKKAAHFLGEAAAYWPILPAMRWAQVRAMGGSPELAAAFARALDRPYEGFETEWSAVIRFTVQHADALSPELVPRIVEFVRYQRLETKTVEFGDIEETIAPLYPGFDIRQATAASLLQRLDTWDRHLKAVVNSIRLRPFPPVRLAEVYEFMTSRGPVRIQRLKNMAELITEGTLMRHCVGTYGAVCMAGESSIWSITSEMGSKRLATLQLSRAGSIVQVQGKANSRPAVEAMEAVELFKGR